MSKILVTGGLGFIGSHTCIELSNDYDLIIIDNLYNSKKNVLDKIIEITKERYSNARDVRRFFEACIQSQSVRLSKKDNKSKLDLMMIKKEDIDNTINNFS